MKCEQFARDQLDGRYHLWSSSFLVLSLLVFVRFGLVFFGLCPFWSSKMSVLVLEENFKKCVFFGLRWKIFKNNVKLSNFGLPKFIWHYSILWVRITLCVQSRFMFPIEQILIVGMKLNALIVGMSWSCLLFPCRRPLIQQTTETFSAYL